MTCKDCDDCKAWNPFPWIEDGKLCDRIPDTWTADEIQQAKDIADCIGSVIDAHSTSEEAQCPTTTSEDSDLHTLSKGNSSTTF